MEKNNLKRILLRVAAMRLSVAIIGSLALGGMVLSGCNAVHGLGKDIESASGKR